MDETWGEVLETIGYMVSSWGQVRSLWRAGGRNGAFLGTDWRTKKLVTHLNGYIKVGIHGEMMYVHRLVLEAFVGPCPPGHECRHLDGNRANNRVDNLDWGTHSSNEKDKKRHGSYRGFIDSRPGAKFDEPGVRRVRELASQGMDTKVIADLFGVSVDTIRQIIRRRTWANVS